MHRYAAAHLGPSFTEPAPWTLDEVFGDTTAQTPIIFILSTGQQPLTVKSLIIPLQPHHLTQSP
jgi:hypothetical protein